MDKDLKDRWIEALRSGRYEQGQGYLCRNNKYCCLGVLAEIEDDLEPSEKDWIMKLKDGDMLLVALLNESYRNQYGLTYDHSLNLMAMNDTGKSFSEIADWIEKNL